jgi:mRNA interferase MazF
VKGYPFEVKLSGQPVSVALADQVKSLDWRARKARKKGKISAAELAEFRSKLHALIG